MLERLLSLFRYHGEIPKSILLRASTLASLTNCYVAFDRDGTCHLFPSKPLLLKNSGMWTARGRFGAFQSEEIKFTKYKYRYSNWELLIEPLPTASIPFSYDKFRQTKVLDRRIFL